MQDWNCAHILQGQQDVPLNSIGIEQSRRCGRYLKQKLRLDDPAKPKPVIVTSDLQRASATAKCVAEEVDVPEDQIEIVPDLRESNFGVVAGHTWKEVSQKEVIKQYLKLILLNLIILPVQAHAKFHEELKQWKQDIHYALPEGESLHHRFERVKNALQTITDKHQGKRVILITHGAVITDIIRCAQYKGPLQPVDVRATNCSITILRYLPYGNTSPGAMVDPVAESEAMLEEKASWETVVVGAVSHLIEDDGKSILSSTRKLLVADDAKAG